MACFYGTDDDEYPAAKHLLEDTFIVVLSVNMRLIDRDKNTTRVILTRDGD